MNSARDWLRNAKERFRAFAHAGEKARSERPRVGLALAGGFARGIAHIGVLRVLREAGIPIDCVAGTSVGALIGTAYCAGTPLEDMEAPTQDQLDRVVSALRKALDQKMATAVHCEAGMGERSPRGPGSSGCGWAGVLPGE